MGLSNDARPLRAAFCSILLFSGNGSSEANAWFSGRPSRSGTLAVMAPGGRDRPLRDWKGMRSNAQKKVDEAAKDAAQGTEETVEAAKGAVSDKIEQAKAPESELIESLELDQEEPQSMAITVGKVAVYATLGVFGVKKLVDWGRAFLKARKGSSAGATKGEETKAVAQAAVEPDEDEAEADIGEEVWETARMEEEVLDGDDKVTKDISAADEERGRTRMRHRRTTASSEAGGAMRGTRDMERVEGVSEEAMEGTGLEGTGVDDASPAQVTADLSYV